ncbi:MAG: 50S ribosomal protein L21e [Candidatus Thorarchaeota archaeon]|nr:50S ribosomal protein L21e [Candidatus Thorarchaeota archaeon]
MVKKSHGYRARTRGLMSKRVREKGLNSPSNVLVDYDIGQSVDIVIDSGFHKGMPHKRYHGKTGVVKGLRGRAIIVDVGLDKATRTLIVRREHLRPSRG